MLFWRVLGGVDPLASFTVAIKYTLEGKMKQSCVGKGKKRGSRG